VNEPSLGVNFEDMGELIACYSLSMSEISLTYKREIGHYLKPILRLLQLRL
jgi:hypothetical protein